MNIILLLIAISLTVSLFCWLLIGRALRLVVGTLCGDNRPDIKEISGLFWQRLYLGLTVFVPMMCVLLFAPNLNASLETNLLASLRFALFGGVSLLLLIAYLVRKQIITMQQVQTLSHISESVEP